MSVLQRTINIFEDNSELGAIKQDFLLLFASTEKVRKKCFATLDANKKEQMALIIDIINRLEKLEKSLQKEKDNEKVTDLSDLPLFQFMQH